MKLHYQTSIESQEVIQAAMDAAFEVLFKETMKAMDAADIDSVVVDKMRLTLKNN